MKKILAIVLAVVALSGCEPSAKEVVMEVMPKALEDCNVYEIKDRYNVTIRVMRCPNSTTSTNYTTGGKSKKHHTNIVIDGETYEKKVDPE